MLLEMYTHGLHLKYVRHEAVHTVMQLTYYVFVS
jgi:hypothetical protein